MDWTLEVVVLPVSDIRRSIAFYRDQVGFHLDHETRNDYLELRRRGFRDGERGHVVAFLETVDVDRFGSNNGWRRRRGPPAPVV